MKLVIEDCSLAYLKTIVVKDYGLVDLKTLIWLFISLGKISRTNSNGEFFPIPTKEDK